MKRFKFSQSGSSMIEMLGVLTVAGMLGFGILKTISAVHGVFIQNMVVDEAQDLQKRISERFRFDGNYNKTLFNNKSCNDDDKVAKYLCDEKIAPFSMCSNGKLYHRGGGEVKVCQYGDNNQYDKYRIVFRGLSKRSCVALAQADWVIRKKSYIYDMSVNPNDESKKTIIYSNYYSGDHGNNVFPVGTSKAMEICNNGDDNTIQLTFF